MARIRTASQVIKENPIKTGATIITSLGVIIGGFLYADERWAHAAEFKTFAAQTGNGLEINRLTSEVGSLRVERQLIQQRIPTIKNRNEMERAQSDLRTLEAELLAKQQLLDRLKTGK